MGHVLSTTCYVPHLEHASSVCDCLLFVQELHRQLDGEVQDAHFDIDSWSQLFATNLR